MKLIVGLGNPGEKYKNNRHNVGHMMIDYVVDQIRNSPLRSSSFEGQAKFKTFKTDCFMNVSGRFVKKIISNFKFQISNLIVIHDDLDIPLGKFKIQKGTGPLLHNGVESVEKALKTKDFWRIRVGIDNRIGKAGCRIVPGESYVLRNFIPEEKKLLFESVFPKILIRLKTDFSL